MLEMLINPRKVERQPWEMFFIGLFYAFLAIVITNWMGSGNPVLKNASGILVVTFTVIFSLPFVFYTLKYEENKIEEVSNGSMSLLNEHKRAIMVFLWLFLGFIVAFASWGAITHSNAIFNFQIQTYCQINRPGSFNECVNQYMGKGSGVITGKVTSQERMFAIFKNNIYVLIFTLVASLFFGAGFIFVLAWNASVIAAAIGIFTKSQLSALPIGLLRYMIHGIPEIAAYFVVALAGGIVSTAVIKHEYGSERFWKVMQDALNLVVVAVIVLLIAALIEVFVTPILF
jgi:stage II sporulation protein M